MTKLPETNLLINLISIFNHIFEKHYFGSFFVFYTNYLVILGDKKIHTQKWCISEKIQTTQVRGYKRFFDSPSGGGF